MAITFTNFDSSYFKVDTEIDLFTIVQTMDLSDSIISFSVTEEANKIMSGSIRFYDPNDQLSNVLRIGKRITIEWGYKKIDAGLASMFQRSLNIDQVFGPMARKGVKANVFSPSGEGGQDGSKIYTMAFYGREFLSGDDRRTWSSPYYRADVIRQTLGRMGVSPAMMYINFRKNGDGPLNRDTAIMQVESNFKFIMRLAVEWRSVFRMGYTADGIPTAIFCDPDKVSNAVPVRLMVGATFGGSIRLDWKSAGRNVLNYSWKNNSTGSGDNVRIMISANGQPQIYRMQAEGESVTMWVLQPDLIAEELARRNLTGQIELVSQWLSATRWEDVRRYFRPVDSRTAPQGGGFSMNGRMLGNPMLTSPMKLELGDGFPDVLKHRRLYWYCNKVSHNIDRSGYFCDFESVDFGGIGAGLIGGGGIQ